MVAITNDRAHSLMTLSRSFAQTANNVVKVSTSDFDAQWASGTTMERQPFPSPPIQSEKLLPKANGESEIDLGQEMVRLHTSETYYVANLRVVASEDELLGTVLDIVA